MKNGIIALLSLVLVGTAWCGFTKYQDAEYFREEARTTRNRLIDSEGEVRRLGAENQNLSSGLAQEQAEHLKAINEAVILHKQEGDLLARNGCLASYSTALENRYGVLVAGMLWIDGDPYSIPAGASWHSRLSDVYHNNTGCKTGNNIEKENLESGTGGRRLCEECAKLNEAMSTPRPVAQQPQSGAGTPMPRRSSLLEIRALKAMENPPQTIADAKKAVQKEVLFWMDFHNTNPAETAQEKKRHNHRLSAAATELGQVGDHDDEEATIAIAHAYKVIEEEAK